MVGQKNNNVPAAVLAAAKREFDPDRRADPPVPAVSAGGTGRVVVTSEVSRPTIYVVGWYRTVRYGELDDFILAIPPDVIEVPAGGDEVVYYHPASGTKVVWYRGDARFAGYAKVTDLGDVDVRALELLQRPEEVLRYAASTLPSSGRVHVVIYNYDDMLTKYEAKAGALPAFWAEMIQRAQGLPWARVFERVVTRRFARTAKLLEFYKIYAFNDGITFHFEDIAIYTIDIKPGEVPVAAGDRVLTAEDVWVGADDAEMRAVVRALAAAGAGPGVIGPRRAYKILNSFKEKHTSFPQ